MKYFRISYHSNSATIGHKVYRAASEEKAIQKFRRHNGCTAILRVEELDETNE